MSDGANFEDDYTIRWYESGDRDAFLSLYDEAFGGGSDEWFEWKYLDNPRSAHVPILVAESDDGAIAGARPQVPFLMRGGDETGIGLRFGDTMVHPEHRRRGVFSNLTARALEYYERVSPRLCFNCPNDLSRPGFLDAGGELVTELVSYYRIQNPSAYVDWVGGDRIVESLGRLAARGYHRTKRTDSSTPDDVEVIRHGRLPIELLASLYERSTPSGIHVVRDETFLPWRYRNPAWEYAAYSAHVGNRTVAALVTGRGRDDGTEVAALVDVLPLTGGEARDRAVGALLATVLPQHDDADVIAYTGRSIPPRTLESFGFLSDASLPLSRVASRSTLVAYDLSKGTEERWSLGGLDAREATNWNLSFADLDAH